MTSFSILSSANQQVSKIIISRSANMAESIKNLKLVGSQGVKVKSLCQKFENEGLLTTRQGSNTKSVNCVYLRSKTVRNVTTAKIRKMISIHERFRAISISDTPMQKLPVGINAKAEINRKTPQLA